MGDVELVGQLKSLCDCQCDMQDGRCVAISFFDPNSIFEGTIRHFGDKASILRIVSQLAHLKSLNLRKCKVGYMPPLATTSLEFLDLSCNDLEEFPTWVVEQPLKHLNLGANRLASMPDLSAMKLETLKLHKNRLASISAPSSVKFLNLYLNAMPAIPNCVWGLKDLEFFSFGVTGIRELPEEIGELSSLRWLSLVANQLEFIPDSFCGLQKLEGARLAKNCLRSLPDKIGEMNLRELTLYSNSLTTVPESFFLLKLRKLNVARNPLDTKRISEVFSGIDFLEF